VHEEIKVPRVVEVDQPLLRRHRLLRTRSPLQLAERCGPRQKLSPIAACCVGLSTAAARARPRRARRGPAAAMVHGRSGGGTAVFGILRCPHLILPYLAYYDHLASHYGGPRCSPTAWWCNYKHLQVPKPSICVKMVGLTVLIVLTMGSPHTKPPPYDFLNLCGACLQAGTEGSQIQVLDNMPRYSCSAREPSRVRYSSRFPCLTAIAGQII
jgi:hypothetical protein